MKNKNPVISVIIPTFNEESLIARAIRSAKKGSDVEIIVVDGGSKDKTIKIAKSCGARVIKSERGRGIQMNMGSTIAKGEILIFLHADTILPEKFDEHVFKIMAKEGVSGGAFRFGLDGRGLKYRIIEFGVGLRTNLFKLPYGDQAIFLSAKLFKEVGRFSDIPLMEDVAIVKKLARRGKIFIAPAPAVSSSRRWQTMGALRATIINYVSILAYLIGFSPQTIAIWYQLKNKK